MLSLGAWENLHKALCFYTGLGFQYIEAPWTASERAVCVTLPEGCSFTRASTPGHSTILVGSAEQSFLEMLLQDELPLKQPLVTLTPCYRLDDRNPETCHHPMFMKVELGYFFHGHPYIHGHARELRSAAEQFLRTLTPAVKRGHHPSPRKVPVAQGELHEAPLEDLEIAGCEVGSYGTRTLVTPDRVFGWAYGTGLAEPRTSWAIDRLIL